MFTTDNASIAVPSANNLNLFGTSTQGISTSASGSTVTFTIADATSAQKGVAKFSSTNFTVSAGNVTSNNFTITAGTGLSGGGSLTLGGSVSVALSSPVSVANGGTGDTSLTLNGVLYGNGTSAVGVTAQGAANTVLLGNGGIPSFGAVPNAALQNSSITLSNGTNISVTGSPVSLGGTATINVSGPITPTSYTTNGVLYGNGTGALQATSQGGANTVLLGNGGVPSFGQVPNAALQNNSITFTAGTNVTFNVSSPAVIPLGGALTINATGGSGNFINWIVVTTATNMTSGNGYLVNSGSVQSLPTSMNLPATCNQKDIIIVHGMNGSWQIEPNVGQNIVWNGLSSTTGVNGALQSTSVNDSVWLICTVANTTWDVLFSEGDLDLI